MSTCPASEVPALLRSARLRQVGIGDRDVLSELKRLLECTHSDVTVQELPF